MKAKLKILAVVNNLGAVAQVRVISPLKYLKANGYIDYEVVDISQAKENPVTYVPDIVILQRLNDISYYGFFKFLKSKGSKIVFELDDNLLELPEKNPAYSLYSDPNLKRSFLEYIWLADHLIVSTENLKNYYSVYNKSITVIPNQIDEEIFTNKKIRRTDTSNIRIGFAGTITHRKDFEQVEQALKEIQRKYKEKIKLVFLNMMPETFATDPSVEFIPGVSSLKEFAQLLNKAKLDIGLAPLAYNKFNMGKSDIKFLEYGISGIAGVYSNFGPYKRTIVNNETGLFVNLENNFGWISKLSYLIENPSEIDRIKINTFKYVSEKRTLQKNYKKWVDTFSQITERKLNISENNKNEKITGNSTKVSIIFITYNQLKFTKKFINSIRKFTSGYELIAVDNKSTDGTIDYLKKLQKVNDNIKLILNKDNLGFPKAVNQALNIAIGKFIVLTNNDIIVTENWLEKLISTAESDSKIGIVGPISNFVSGVQLDKNAKYNSIDEMHKYATKISVGNKGKTKQFPRVAFLCTLIKKELIDKIGGLDERFSPGNFEDDDFCLRAQLSGYKTIIAEDVFIHHYGSVSFKANGEDDYAKRLEINKNIFIKKWGTDPEGIWLKGEKFNKREIQFPINSDKFIESFQQALINIEEEDHDLALNNLKIAIESFDNSNRKGYENITKTELLNLAGSVSLAKNEIEIAKEYFEQELNINPNSSEACFGLGEVFNQMEMFENAKTMYEWSVANDINNQNAKKRLAEINSKLNLPVEHNSLIEENIE